MPPSTVALCKLVFVMFAVVLNGVGLTSTARAGELVKNKSDGVTSEDFTSGAGLPSRDASATVIGGRTYSVSTTKLLPDVKKLKEHICSHEQRKKTLCASEEWPPAQRSYEAAAKALGVPEQVLMCLTRIESNMQANAQSTVDGKPGARGLTQFMPATAHDLARKFQDSKPLKKAWSDYKALGGTIRDERAVTEKNITSLNLSESDIEIFATAMYFRTFLGEKGVQAAWADRIGEPPKASMVRKMYHFLMISYNAGPAVGEKWMKGDISNYSKLPKETQGYIDNFDSCIDMQPFKTNAGKAVGGGTQQGRRPND